MSNIALIHVKPTTTTAEDRRGGFSDEILISEIGEFTDIKTPGAWAAPGDSKKITTAHTFTGTDGFFELRARRGTVAGDGESIGEEGGGIMEYKPVFEVVGDNAVMCEYMENILQKELIVLFGSPTCDSTNPYVQYGSKCSAAVIDKITYRSAKKSEGGLKVYTITLKTTEKFFYSGTVTKNSA